MLWGSDLNRVTTLPTLPTNCPAQFATLFFVGNVGYQFSIANIANKLTGHMAAWPHGRMAAWPHGIGLCWHSQHCQRIAGAQVTSATTYIIRCLY
jgi:hypothetical protein